tara:strand:- start:446 stop:1978 length:1533 start_codon:yes stop_codon:yes gene_type:complete
MSFHEEAAANNPDLYTIGGITYNENMVPIEFSDDYEGPRNALVGSITASNGETYGVYADYLQNNNEVQNSSGDVLATGINVNSTGTILNEEAFSTDDVTSVQEVMTNVEASGNIKPMSEIEKENEVSNEIVDDNSLSGSVDNLRQDFEIGKVDHIIQKLALRNLIYPIDADYNTQDYMQINQFTYKPVNQQIFFPTQDDKDAGIFTSLGILQGGVKNESAKEKHLGLVKLPMPNQLQDSNNVAWGQDQLNAITAAAAAGVFDATGDALNVIRGLATGQTNFQDIVNMVKTRAGNFGDNLAKAASGAKDVAGSNNAAMLAQSAVGSFLLNVAQFGVTPETALARGAGVVPNSNMQLLFNAPTLREFTFNWRFTPRSQEEATRVKNIIRFFKQGMAVKKGNKTKSGSSKSFFLGTPNIFDIHFKTAKTGKYQILDRNDSVMRIKTCALTGVAVNYTPEGMWNAYEKGMPTSMLLSLRFGELEPIFDTDYEEDPFKYDTSFDVGAVPIDAIGY